MKKKTDSLQKPQLSPKVVFALGVGVPFLLYSFVYLFAGIYPFGNKIFLDADSFHQYLPFLTELRRKLVSGESLFYSFSGGLGYNFWTTIAYYAASPLNFLLILIPEANVCDFMVWMTVLKVSLCGGIFAWYLWRQNCSTPLFAIAFGTMYAFSNYLISYKYNIMWLDSIAVVPLIMYGLEKIVQGKHPGCYLLSLFYAIWCNYYIGYMICVFSCLYLIFLLVAEEKQEKKSLVNTISVFAFSSLAAGGMASILLVPSFLALQASTAMVSGESTDIQLLNNFLSMFRAHYMESSAFRTSYQDGDVHLYCGTSLLILAPLFFSDSSIKKRIRISYAVFLGFLLLSFTFSPLNFAWHGFHHQTALPNRFSFLYDIMLLKMCYSVVPNLKNIRKHLWKVVLGVFGVSVLFAVWDIVARNSFRVSFLSIGCIALYTVVLYEFCTLPKKEKHLSFLLCSLIVMEAWGFEAIDVSLNGEGWERSTWIDWQNDYHQLIENQRMDGFFRSDIDSEITNLITFFGGNGTALFNSTMQDNICNLFRGMNFPYDLNMVNNLGGTKLSNDLLGVRYFVSEGTSADLWNGFEKVASLNGKNLYENDQALSLGFMLPEKIVSWQPEILSGMNALNALADILCDTNRLYSLRQTFRGESGVPVSFDLPEDETIYVILDDIPRRILWDSPEHSSSYERRLQNLALPAAASCKEQQATLTVTTISGGPYTGKVYFCRTDDYKTVIDALSQNQMEQISVSGNSVSGRITASENGILLLTIPFNDGWSISVDNSPVDSMEIGGALTGVHLVAGEHQIEMQFTPPGLTLGILLSLVSVLLTFFIYLFFYRKQKISC